MKEHKVQNLLMKIEELDDPAEKINGIFFKNFAHPIIVYPE